MTAFREQAAITWASTYRHHMHVTRCAVEHAQELADACCKAWGHEKPIERFGHPNATAVCSRCGRDPNHPVPDPPSAIPTIPESPQRGTTPTGHDTRRGTP